MSTFDRPDNLVVKTHHDGTAAEVTVGDQRMVQLDPSGVTITRGLTNRFPDPADPQAAQLVERIFQAHRESDGPILRAAIDEFRTKYGWHPRVEWFDVLAKEMSNAPDLLEAQRGLIGQYEELLAAGGGAMVPLAGPLYPDTLRWALGANYLNLMEWLWKGEDFSAALECYEPSLLGLRDSDDNGRRVERLLIKASCEARLGDNLAAESTVQSALALDQAESARLWKLYAPKMPELARWMEN